MPEEGASLPSTILRQPLVGLIPLLVSLFLLALSSLRRRLLLLLPMKVGTGGGEGRIHRRLESRCAVCLDDTSLGKEKFRVLPECGHGFHTECLDRWLRCRRTCPLCRRTVAEDRRSCRERLLAALLSSFCRWMDSQFDSQLTSVFCHNL